VASRPAAAAFDVALLSFRAMTVSTLKLLSASLTLMVPIAEERRPEKGNTSGERLHCTFRLMRPTIVLSASTMGAVVAPVASLLKIAACWPFPVGEANERKTSKKKERRKIRKKERKKESQISLWTQVIGSQQRDTIGCVVVRDGFLPSSLPSFLPYSWLWRHR
jgi:hypothetical protein